MSVLINFKICDNAEECFGLEVCKTGALSWDEKNKTIEIDNDKCISCGACEDACEVNAIKVAHNDEEYQALQKEIDDDPTKISDFMLDRYGAQPILPAYLIPEELFEGQVVKAKKMTAAELFKNENLECMIKSIPIKQLFDGYDIKFRKVELKSDELLKKYEIKNLPALVFFKEGKLLGKIEGYYTTNQIDKIKEKIGKIIS